MRLTYPRHCCPGSGQNGLPTYVVHGLHLGYWEDVNIAVVSLVVVVSLLVTVLAGMDVLDLRASIGMPSCIVFSSPKFVLLAVVEGIWVESLFSGRL